MLRDHPRYVFLTFTLTISLWLLYHQMQNVLLYYTKFVCYHTKSDNKDTYFSNSIIFEGLAFVIMQILPYDNSIIVATHYKKIILYPSWKYMCIQLFKLFLKLNM